MLSCEERAILDFERGWWVESGPKDVAIEMRLGLSSAAYYERLLDLVADPEAMGYDPLTVRRVRSVIESPRAKGVAVS